MSPTWLAAERIVVNVYQRYPELNAATPQLNFVPLQVLLAERS